MKCIITYINLLFYILLIFSNCARQDDFPVLKGPYLGQKPPETTPEIFAPHIVSTGFDELCSVFSSDLREFYFSIQMPGHIHHTMLCIKLEKNGWTKPQVLPFSGRYSDAEIAFSPDEKKLFFASFRPDNTGGEKENNWDIWYVEKMSNGWSKPKNLGPPINSDQSDTYPSFTKDGTLYFASNRKGSLGGMDIYYSRFINSRYTEPKNLGDPINTEFPEEGMISSDGSYLIFTSCGRPDSYGGCDLYISFRKNNGTWTEPKNMGETINSSAHEYCPSISPDGRYFFFSSFRRLKHISSKPIYRYEDIIDLYNSPGNGNGDIYWMDAKIIEELRDL